MRKLICFLSVLGIAAAFAERQSFERYRGIVDRQMFGPLPPDFDPTKMPSEVAKSKAKPDKELTKEQEQVKKAIRFSVMNVSAAGETFVGFTDSADPKVPVHYYLKAGESQNGWTVKEADAESSSMTIVNKDGVEVTLRLGGDSATNAAAVNRPDSPAAAQEDASRPWRTRKSLFGEGSLQNSRRSRREREERYEADAARRAEEAKARAEREAQEKLQREAEREEHRQQISEITEELRRLSASKSTQSAKDTEKPADDEQ